MALPEGAGSVSGTGIDDRRPTLVIGDPLSPLFVEAAGAERTLSRCARRRTDDLGDYRAGGLPAGHGDRRVPSQVAADDNPDGRYRHAGYHFAVTGLVMTVNGVNAASAVALATRARAYLPTPTVFKAAGDSLRTGITLHGQLV